MQREEIGKKFQADILKAAEKLIESQESSVEVKPVQPAPKLDKECRILKNKLAEMGISVEYNKRGGSRAILTLDNPKPAKLHGVTKETNLKAWVSLPKKPASDSEGKGGEA